MLQNYKALEEHNMLPDNYASALQELEHIVSDLQNDAIPIQDLTRVVARAGVLLQFCKNHLRQTEDEINQLLDM